MPSYQIEGPCSTHALAYADTYTNACRVARGFGKGSAIYRMDTGNCVLRYN
jgi:hypothetical protein